MNRYYQLVYLKHEKMYSIKKFQFKINRLDIQERNQAVLSINVIGQIDLKTKFKSLNKKNIYPATLFKLLE